MQNAAETDGIAARVARERAAHEDPHIDDALRKWWAVFPHVFSNPSMKALNAFYEAELGQVQDKMILEFGCGQGDFALWLLERGAKVSGIDVSEFNVRRCEEKAKARQIDPDLYSFRVMDAHKTTFTDGMFDRVVGNGILHHLDLPASMAEINRVLKPGAKALFQEPLGENPLLRSYRRMAGIHTADERPLTREDLRYLADQWGIKAKYSGLVTLPVSLLTSIVARAYPDNWFLQAAAHFEDQLNRHHVLDHWNRFAVLVHVAAS